MVPEFAMFGPVVWMAVLTALVLIWTYVKRLPAMSKMGVDPQDAQHPGSLNQLPSSARQVADNYNHLFEQPTLFYVLVITVWAIGATSTFYLVCAWGFALSRTLHTLIQCTYNKVMHRFTAFMISWLFLFGIIGGLVTYLAAHLMR